MNEKEFLTNYNIADYERPSIATDIAVFSIVPEGNEDNYRKESESKLKLLLIKRKEHPFKDSWALPGGFLKKGEVPKKTAFRELSEETGVKGAYLRTLDVFGEPNRDPRGWIISHAFLALIDSSSIKLNAGSDALDASWFEINVDEKHSVKNNGEAKQTLYALSLFDQNGIKLSAEIKRESHFEHFHEINEYSIIKSDGFSFDHALIVLRAYLELKDMTEKDGRIVFDLLPEYFTLYKLQKAFEVILGRELLTANFRRKMSDYVIETDKTDTKAGHRPAKLYIRNIEKF